MDDHEVEPAGPRTSGKGPARRCGTAATVGAALSLVWLTVTNTASLDAALSRAELGALGIVVWGLPAGALLAWPLLWAAGVRRAGLVALLAPVPVVALWHLLDLFWLDAAGRDGRLGAWPLPVLTAAGYAAAALATAPGVRLRWWRPAVSAAMAAMVVVAVAVTGPAQSRQANDQLEGRLRAFGHPLYAPDLPGFRLVNAGTSGTLGAGLTFYYQLWSTDAHGRQLEVRAEQTTVPAGFDPPTDCRAVLTIRTEAVPCALVAPEVWSIDRTGYRLDVARRDDQLIRLSSAGDVSDNALLEAATSLRERPAGYFSGISAGQG
ncbi:hypothetical protein OG738_40550 [Amycolatopsis sp. NBC_01488]|uniref:hypothetical protein n=1 Tax=Amycolatopsis sp. NBC_01488 TaxID=2903563 RepID=UPI002E2BB1E9|nr:hypothetical protein [Amycolatopsis sp. NBC_01488]